MIVRIGADIADRAPHQASVADEHGEPLWSGYRFRTSPADLEQMRSRHPSEVIADDVTVVMEPTRNAWVPLAAWFRRRGEHVVLVPAVYGARERLRHWWLAH